MKRLAILGSTGSIGRQTLEIVRAFPDKFEVIGLAAGKSLSSLRAQIAEFKPRVAYCEVEAAREGSLGADYARLEDIASHPDVDLVVVATAGKAGLGPSLAAVRSGKTVALANKEVLVMAGEIVMGEAARYRAEVLPIDSEHSAIWQCLRGEQDSYVSRLLLTASGGPFRLKSPEQVAMVTPEEALAHPTWQMGTKVTIDSATLMNKGMELVEARWLFGVPFDRMQVVIHPQSVIHSLVEFVDGSVKAQMSLPDMRLPIQYALTYPERWRGGFQRPLDLVGLGSLTFEAADEQKFPCLKLAVEAGRRGGTYPAVLSAADDVAVSLFLGKRIGFGDIAGVVGGALDSHNGLQSPTLDDILAADAWAREYVESIVK